MIPEPDRTDRILVGFAVAMTVLAVLAIAAWTVVHLFGLVPA